MTPVQSDWVLLPSVEPTTSTTERPIRMNVTTAAATSVPASPAAPVSSLSSSSPSSQTASSPITSHTKPTARPSNTKPSSAQGKQIVILSQQTDAPVVNLIYLIPARTIFNQLKTKQNLSFVSNIQEAQRQPNNNRQRNRYQR